MKLNWWKSKLSKKRKKLNIKHKNEFFAVVKTQKNSRSSKISSIYFSHWWMPPLFFKIHHVLEIIFHKFFQKFSNLNFTSFSFLQQSISKRLSSKTLGNVKKKKRKREFLCFLKLLYCNIIFKKKIKCI